MELARNIGTPLTPNATKVLVLGAGELGKGLAAAFQKLGLEVHAVDRYAGAPGAQIAQFSYVADVTSAEEVRELAARIQPDFVVPEVENVSVEALAFLDEHTPAVVVPTARALELTQTRDAMRAAAAEIGLPTTAIRVATSHEELEAAAEELGYPCIVKPDVATSGKGHMIVRGPEDIEDAWVSVRRVSTDEHRVIAERFVDFDYEATILAVRSIDPSTGNLATWFSEPIGHRHAHGDLVEVWQPLAMSQRAMENARSMAARISNALGGRGVYGVELFIAGDDVYFSSVTPRPADTGMVTHYTQRFSQFDLHARAILGYPIDVTLVSPGAAVVLHASQAASSVVYSGVAEAMTVAETDVRLFGKPDAYPGRRMGIVASTADTVEEARDRAATAAERIYVGSEEALAGASSDSAADSVEPLDLDIVEVEEPVVAVDTKRV